MLAVITAYPFIVSYLIPSQFAGGELTSLFGWSWQTWLIILLVSIILTLLMQNWIEKFDKDINTPVSNTNTTKTRTGDFSPAVVNSPNARVTVEQNVKELPPPILVLKISNGEDEPDQKITLLLTPLPEKPDTENAIENKRKELLERIEDNESKSGEKSLGLISELIRVEKQGWSDRVEEYLEKYRIYLNDVWANAVLDYRYMELSLVLENRVRPASNVVIQLEFPKDFPFPPNYITYLVRMNNISLDDGKGGSFTEKHEVEPPEQPNPYMSDKARSYLVKRADYYSLRNEKIDIGEIEIDLQKRKGRTFTTFHFDSVLHNLASDNFPPIIMWLLDIKSGKSWVLPYQIYANELPEPIEGTIEIKAVVKSKKRGKV